MFISKINPTNFKCQNSKSLQFKGKTQQLKTVVNTIKPATELNTKALLGSVITGLTAFITAKSLNNTQKNSTTSAKQLKKKNISKYTYKNYDKLQKRLGNIKLAYCVKYGLLKMEEDGSILTERPENKEFLDKIDNKEVKISDFYISKRNLARTLKCNENKINSAIKDGELVLDEHYGIDINNPTNKAFIDFGIKKAEGNLPESKPVQSKWGNNIAPNHMGIKEFGRKFGLVPASVRHHISKGHIICDDGGIDLTNPLNIYFMNNYKRGEAYVAPNQQTNTVKQVTTIPTIKTDFNDLKTSELMDMLRISVSPIKNNLNKGLLVKNENNKFSLDEPINKAFINKYDEDITRLCRCSTDEHLEKYVDSLKKLLKNRISTNIYKVASEVYDNSEEFSKYLKYSLEKIVDFSTLNSLQTKMLSVIFEEIIVDELNSEKHCPPVYYKSDKKLDIMLYKHLLNALNLRNGNVHNLKETENYEEYNIGEVKISQKLDEIFEKAEYDYCREIETYKNLASQKIDDLVDDYMQYKFSEVAKNYFDLRNFNNKMLGEGLPFETDNKKINFIVEKILPKVATSKFEPSYNYMSWKKDFMPKNATSVVSDIIYRYGETLMKKICTKDALKELQKTNPELKIEMQDLRDTVSEKFDL